jgi:hypothetical protein
MVNKEIVMLKIVMTAAALSLMVCAGASAFPGPKSQINASTSDFLILVGKKHHHHHNAYKHGYKHPPKGWKSYSHRPLFWERKGCIVIGRTWYCD